jgi:putative transposase
VLARLVRRDWRRHLVVVRPDRVIRWHRQAWRLVWRGRSRGHPGRPRLSAEVRELIATRTREHPARGAERIRGEWLKPGIAGSTRSIRRYRRRGPARPPPQPWRTCLANQAAPRWAADLLTVQTLTRRPLYALVFIAHGRRELVHLNVTANPIAAGAGRQVVAATARGRRPRFPLRDRDAAGGGACRQRAQRRGTETLLPPLRAPRANAIAERVLGTLRRACRDHRIIVNAQRLRSVLAEFLRSSTTERPQRALRLDTPRPPARSSVGPIRSHPILGGPHHLYERHVYERAA